MKQVNFTLRPYQTDFVNNLARALRDHRRVIACAATGSGKCLAKGTKVLMFDGSSKKVEDVKIGDVLMGPDSMPRNVISLAHGFEEMYDIIPTKGEKYTVNESHILSLKITGTNSGCVVKGKSYLSGEIVNISVKDYLKTSKTFKHWAKGYRVGVDFPKQEKELKIDPYFLGMWLGGGSRGDACITTIDKEVIDYLIRYADSIGCIGELREYNGRTTTVYFKDKIHKGRSGCTILNALKYHECLYEKHIPSEFKCGSREVRLNILAGLIDSDGSLSQGCVDFISKNESLANDFCFIARSLGFAAYIKKCIKKCKNSTVKNHSAEYCRVSLSGDLSMIPTKILRKKAQERQQNKNVLMTGIKVNPVGYGEYFGFTLDGDSLFLLSDFTVTHNTKMFIEVARRSIENGRTVVIISETTKIFDQIINEAGGKQIANGEKHVHIRGGELYIAMAQTLTRRPLIIQQLAALEFPPLIIVDEAHIGTPSNIIRRLIEASNPYILGFTATPDARVAKHLPELYNSCVVCCQVDELIQQGFLCSYRHKARTKADTNLLELRNGEFTEESQEKAFGTNAVYDGIFEDLRSAKFVKAMIFVSSIKHAKEMNGRLKEQGFASIEYHSKLENPSYELAKFTELDMANICVSVASLTKGFDYPLVDMPILARATTSLPLYLQMLGRASRPVWDNFGNCIKSEFTAYDYGDNWKRHGLYFEDREWDKMWEVTKRGKRGEGVAPVALCPSCESIIPASVRICQYCGHERPLTEKELEQGELVEVTSHYTNLVGRLISQLTPSELAIYAKMKKKQPFAARVARAQEQVKQGFLDAFTAAMGYKPSWADHQKRMIGSSPIDYLDIQLR